MVEKKDGGKKLLTTKDIADQLKIDPKALRRVLRTLPRYKNSEEYNRYEWDPDNATDAKFLKSLPSTVESHIKAEKEKKAAKADTKKKAPKKKAAPAPKKKKAAKKKAAPSPSEKAATEHTQEVESEEVEELV